MLYKIALLSILSYQISSSEISTALFPAIVFSDKDNDREEALEDSIELAKEKRDDSLDLSHDKMDKVQDSIQEEQVGPEGRRLRLSFGAYFTFNNSHLLALPELSIINRTALFEYGLSGLSFQQSNPEGEHFFLTASPTLGFLPLLSRPLRITFGAGMAFQFETSNHFKTSFAPFIYSSGTIFFVKRISSTLNARLLHLTKGTFGYYSSDYYPKEDGDSWIDIGISVDFYF
jgi:hypothetical protein